MTRKFYLRFADSADQQNVFDFYAHNTHPFVFRRDAEVWRERIANGAVTMIEDENKNIVAAAISYPVLLKDANDNEYHAWTEVGSVNVALKDSGLFTPLVTAHVMRAYLFEPPEERFVAEIKAANTHSFHCFTKSGWREFQVPQNIQDKIFETIVPEDRDPTARWVFADGDLIAQMAQYIHTHLQQPLRGVQKDGGDYEISFAKSLLAQPAFRSILETIATGKGPEADVSSKLDYSPISRHRRHHLGL